MVKEEFVAKFEQIVESIIQNKTKVEQRLVVEKTKRDQLNTEYIDLVEQQRLYFKAVKEFKEVSKSFFICMFFADLCFHVLGMQDKWTTACPFGKQFFMKIILSNWFGPKTS